MSRAIPGAGKPPRLIRQDAILRSSRLIRHRGRMRKFRYGDPKLCQTPRHLGEDFLGFPGDSLDQIFHGGKIMDPLGALPAG